MCYDIKTNLEKQLRRAILDGDEARIVDIQEKLSIFSPDQIELHHASGFTHPKMIVYGQDAPYDPILAQWGLVPHWVRSEEQKQGLWNKTLNARGETIWEKPSFKQAASSGRCLVFLEGFYEHRHFKGKTYPYFIQRKDRKLLPVAGILNTWRDEQTGADIPTFSIVTTRANELMTIIHNNPKLPEPRMPLILPDELQEQWLLNIEDPGDLQLVNELILPYPDDALDAYTVGSLRGKNAVGNVPEAAKEVLYPVLVEDENPKLF